MSKKGGTTVEGVDPWEAGRADATFNRIDQYTPFGSLIYSGPNRNQANLQLNPYLAGTENRRMMSDRMLLDMALGRQQGMAQGGLPSLTSGIDPGALNNFFGLPSSMQTGFDAPNQPPNVPNIIGQSAQPGGGSTGGSKGGGTTPPGPNPTGPNPNGPMPLPGTPGYWDDPRTPRSVLDPAYKGGAQPTAPATMGGMGIAPGGPPSGQTMQQYQASRLGGAVGKPQPGPTSQKGGSQYNQDNLLGGSIGAAIGNPLDQVSGAEQALNRFDPLGTTAPAQQVYGGIDPNTYGQLGNLNQLGDFGIDRASVEQDFYDRSASLLNPQFDQAQQAKVADLRARGIPRDSEAFEREMANFNRSKGETFENLARDATLFGGQEQSRQFGMADRLGDRSQNAIESMFGMSSGLGNQVLNAGAMGFGLESQLGQQRGGAQQQLFNMADMLGQRDIQAQLQNANMAQSNRATQFNELASLLGLQQVASPGLNNFFAPGNVDMMGAYGMQQQAGMANAQNAANQKGGILGGLGQLGGAALGNWGEIFR